MTREPPESLTDRQAAVLTYIAEHIEETGYPPTIREIGDELGITSTNGVNDHLKALERKGYLDRTSGKSRALKPLRRPDGTPISEAAESDPEEGATPTADGVQRVPLVGRIAAGTPREAIENADQHLDVGEGLVGRNDDVFALEVDGDSMIDDGIYDGDYIFVRPQETAKNGEIVAAMVDGEATVKRFFREEDRIRLQPSNPAMSPIYLEATDGNLSKILGRVVGVYRAL